MIKQKLISNLKEACFSVLPITVFITVVSFLPFIHLQIQDLILFWISSILLILGIGLFNLGAQMSMSNIGSIIGQNATKKNNILLLIGICFLLGFLITIAEPDLAVLAGQTEGLFPGGSWALILLVGLGVAFLLSIAVLKTVYHKDLSYVLMVSYFAVFLLACIVIMNDKAHYIGLSFDSGGVTTGPMTVPFLMALGFGISTTIRGKQSEENSFGFISLCSVGPICIVLIMSLLSKGQFQYDLPDSYLGFSWGNVLPILLTSLKDVALPIGLILVFFYIFDKKNTHLSMKKWRPLLIGSLFAFVGLVLFLTVSTLGFMPIGFLVGQELSNQTGAAILICFILGTLTVLAEPAVHVLTETVETVTGGVISRKSIFIALCIGVGLAVSLSIIKIYYEIPILYFLIPGYFLSFLLCLFVPKIYTAIAFDSGGVASGPLTSSFILPLAIGFSLETRGVEQILEYGFGVVAFVAMTPIITIQVLGFIALVRKKHNQKVALKHMLALKDDHQIIHFM